MRQRFFLIVFAFLSLSVLVVSVLQQTYIENERLRAIDQRLETLASSLVASGLSFDFIHKLETTDDVIQDLLGEERVDHLINIYNLDDGNVLAQNVTAEQLPLEFNTHDRWQTVEVQGRQIRVLNLPHGKLNIQIGLILENGFTQNKDFVFRFLGFMLANAVILVGAAFFSSRLLFSPLRSLAFELQAMSRQLDSRLGQPLSSFAVSPELEKLARGRKRRKDEFEKLAEELAQFILKLESYTKSFNSQTAILTHELKTPLTVLRNSVEQLRSQNDQSVREKLQDNILSEIDRLAKIINDFLQWSVLTSNPEKPNGLFAVKVGEVSTEVSKELNSIFSNRIIIEYRQDSTVFCVPEHFRQLLNNLLVNALKYSPESQTVILEIETDKIRVRDRGDGLPADVLQHLGSPFNRGGGAGRGLNVGSGLGLAWVNSICEKYSWSLKFYRNGGTTVAEVSFPVLPSEEDELA